MNCDSAIEIAKVCESRGKRMLFISTEQLFNGKSEPGPFGEDVEPNCVTNYGQQKAEVDAWLQENSSDHVTLRLSWMFGMAMPGVKPSPGIVGNVLKALRTETPTKFTVNEKRCMTYAQQLADNFGKICELPSGTYHASLATTTTGLSGSSYRTTIAIRIVSAISASTRASLPVMALSLGLSRQTSTVV